MQTAASIKPWRSRRPWYWIAGFVVVIVATPFVVSLIGEWLLDRELAAICRELDADDPHWRWDDMVANQPPPLPNAENAAVQLLNVNKLLAKTPFTPPATKAGKTAPKANIRLA